MHWQKTYPQKIATARQTKTNKTNRAFYFTHELLYWIVCLLARTLATDAHSAHTLCERIYALILLFTAHIQFKCSRVRARHTLIHTLIYTLIYSGWRAAMHSKNTAAWVQIKTIMLVHMGRFKIKQSQHGKILTHKTVNVTESNRMFIGE